MTWILSLHQVEPAGRPRVGGKCFARFITVDGYLGIVTIEGQFA